jgi:hypothetical protein
LPSWNQLLDDVKRAGSTYDIVRSNMLSSLSEHTRRNVIVYYSGWLQKGGLLSGQRGIRFEIYDGDKEGFMATIHGLDRKLGLDLILHTPGGDVAATESLIHYLQSMFDGNIRAIVPQLAMSGGTMIACACREIVMGKHSSLGPIDPQFNGLPAHGILEEFQTAFEEIKKNPAAIPLWQPIIAKYHPTLIGECEKAVKWAAEIARESLKSCMFANDRDKDATVEKIIAELGDHALHKSHSRHISMEKAKKLGLKIVELESDPVLQDRVLSVHHACILTLSETAAFKVIQNQKGGTRIDLAAAVVNR